MPPVEAFCAFLLGIFVVSLLATIIQQAYSSIKAKKYSEFVLRNSQALVNLKEINAKYNFQKVEEIAFQSTYDNEDIYSDLTPSDILIYNLANNKEPVIRAMKAANENKRLYAFYQNEVSEKCELGKFGEHSFIRRKSTLKAIKKEEKFELYARLKSPKTIFSICVTLNLTTKDGWQKESNKEWFNANQIEKIIKRVTSKSGDYYLDNDVWQSICRVERGKVTNKMRFAIYDRDGHRCRKCGSSYNLEIDHIFPISKGGKSTPNNLQTLCQSCNKKKSNAVEYKSRKF